MISKLFLLNSYLDPLKYFIMNVKRFLISGTIAGIAYFLLGWQFYGIILKIFFQKTETKIPPLFFYDA